MSAPPTTRIFHCAHVLESADRLAAADLAIRIEGERIARLEPSSETAERLFAMPVLANAHDHARTLRASSFGAGGKPLEIWLHYLALLPAADPYLTSGVSLARSALGGCGVVMVHYTRVQGLTDLPTEAKEVARAARDVGVRVGFAVAMRDANPLVYGPSEPILSALAQDARDEITKRLIRSPMPVNDQLALVDAVAAAAHSATFDVQYGPNGVQWASQALLEGIAEASARSGRRIHMHLLETRYQRDWADTTYPDGIVRHLDSIGLLSPRLTLAHCTWARPDELELIAERGATIAVNTSSNLGLRSGVAPVGEMLARGCRVALGIDGLALDEDDDALREMRLAHLLHGGTGFETRADRSSVLAMAFRNGRRSVLNADAGGALTVGEPADILLLDWDAVDDDRLRSDLDPLDLLLSRSTAGHIREMIVAGRSIVRDGEVLGVDYPAMRHELLMYLRAEIKKNGAFATALFDLEKVIKSHFEPDTLCC